MLLSLMLLLLIASLCSASSEKELSSVTSWTSDDIKLCRSVFVVLKLQLMEKILFSVNSDTSFALTD